MKLIVGLGNPGNEYRLTRHNLGFTVVEELAERHNIKLRQHRRFKALAGEGVIEGETSYLAMPQTYMNLSGNSVRSIVKWLGLAPRDILLVVDEAALPFGSIRIKPKGSDAGHKGLRSVIDCLGSNEFSRIRIGIMGEGEVNDLSAYVLDRLTKKERKILPDILEHAVSACECWITLGIEAAMNRYNQSVRRKV